MDKKVIIIYTPLRPMYSAIWPLTIAPTIAPTLDKDPIKENWPQDKHTQHKSKQNDLKLVIQIILRTKKNEK